MKRAAEQIIGREGETATFLSRCLFNSELRVAVSPHVNSIVRRFSRRCLKGEKNIMWRCLNCGEESEDSFDVCWNCQTMKGESSPRPITVTQPELVGSALPQSSQSSVVDRTRSSALSTRYKDAYLVAKVTDGLGKTIKKIGFILAGVILLATIAFAKFAANQPGANSDVSGGIFSVIQIFGLANAFFVGFVFYIIGVIVSAQGQVLKATLDNTIGNSPFLTSDLKARIMSLPEA